MHLPITYRELITKARTSDKEVSDFLRELGDRVLSGEQFYEIPKKAVDAAQDFAKL